MIITKLRTLRSKVSPGLFPAASLLLALSLAPLAAAQAPPVTALGRQLARIDLGVSGIGVFSKDTTGPNYLGQQVNLKPSTTFGPLIQLRYTKSPLIGAELTYAFPRYTDNYTYSSFILGVQSQHAETSLGYLAHVGNFLGLQPFAGVGAGGISFRPTRGGGQGLQTQVRFSAYYEVGAETLVFGEHFGLRAQFRQLFYAAPDYNQNYLANGSRSVTSEPSAGFFLRF